MKGKQTTLITIVLFGLAAPSALLANTLQVNNAILDIPQQAAINFSGTVSIANDGSIDDTINISKCNAGGSYEGQQLCKNVAPNMRFKGSTQSNSIQTLTAQVPTAGNLQQSNCDTTSCSMKNKNNNASMTIPYTIK